MELFFLPPFNFLLQLLPLMGPSQGHESRPGMVAELIL